MNHRMFVDRLGRQFEEEVQAPVSAWSIEAGLSNKVTREGEFRPFFGATSVFPLSVEDREKCELLQFNLAALMRELAFVDPATFHITLHSFANMNNVSLDKQEVERAIASSESDVQAAFSKIRRQYAGSVIQMRALGVKTTWKEAVSLQFVPSSDADSSILLDLFAQLEEVYPLHKPYQPHVTLGYLLARPYRDTEVFRLKEAVREVNAMSMPVIALQVSDLVYQYHLDMNHYVTVYTLLDT
ncbi:hypothetical protein DUZ99_03555 [Xylanibacillus composti]|nr:hypothetical protein [Xylanibacillus composti]MDT9724076.1 hypothetical protein [Xylanibacillus composti]